MTEVTFKYDCHIKASPDHVWEGLTTSEFTRQYWHESNIESNFKVGDPLVFKYQNGKDAVVGKIMKAEKPNLLSYTWRFTDKTSMPMEEDTLVTFILEEREWGTKLTVIHEGYSEDDPIFNDISNGWPMVLCSLKSLLETGKPMETAR